MEKIPGTKCEQFAWNDGLRIVDLSELSKQLHCKQCRALLDLQHTEREARYGLASILFILCKCGATNDVHTGKLQHSGQKNSSDPIFEVNSKASVNLLMFRTDASRILSFLALLDIPVPASDDPTLTPPLKDNSAKADSTCSSDYPPYEMRALYSSPATDFSVDPEVSGTSLTPIHRFSGPDSDVDSVPLVLPSHQHRDREDGSDWEDNDNGCDNDESVSSVGEGDLKERKNDVEIIDSSKANICRRGDQTTCDITNEPHILENNKEKEEHTPPKRIRTKAQNLHGMKKPSTELSRKTRTASTREPSKKVIQKVRKTRTKLEKDTHHAQTIKEQDTKKQTENNDIDFSNTMEWSSTESEPDASQGRDSDASWEVEAEKETAAKPKRGRGRPKGSTDKVKRTRKRGRDAGNAVCGAELKTEGVGANGVPRCDACGKDFSSVRGYNLHVRRMHKPGGHLQDSGSTKRERQKQEGGDEEPDSETKGRLYRIPLKDSVLKRKLVHRNGTETISYQCRKCYRVFSSPASLGNHLCIIIINSTNSNNSNNSNNNSKNSNSSSNNNNNSNNSSSNDNSSSNNSSNNNIVNSNNDSTTTTNSNNNNNSNNIIINTDSNTTTTTTNNSNNNNNSRLSCLSLNPDGNKIRGKAVELALRHKPPPPPPPCLCNVCGKVYANRGTLKTHIRAVHAQKDAFACSTCDAAFARPSSLRAHTETHRADRPRPFVCQTCGKRFFAANHLKKHARTQHAPPPSERFSCPVCGKEFSTRRSRDNHAVIHSGKRAFSCSTCCVKFYKRYNLTVHERIHSGVKPYRCAVCRLAFAQKNSLDTHMRKHGSGTERGATVLDSGGGER